MATLPFTTQYPKNVTLQLGTKVELRTLGPEDEARLVRTPLYI